MLELYIYQFIFSGGELRRISFAITLLHQPPLLILDEPTVGVDPILRKNIWNYLVKISSDENTTVIITTHYIEEARQANKIAFMRDGSILAQDEPDSLINRYNASTLEDVFLLLCEKSSKNKQGETYTNAKTFDEINCSALSTQSQATISSPAIVQSDDNRQQRPPNSKKSFILPSFTRVKALTTVNFTKMWRNFMLIVLQFFSPVFQLLLVYWSIGVEPRHLNVAVFNQDTNFGPRYLNYIDNLTIQQVTVDGLDKGEELVRQGEAWAVINILPNFTSALMTSKM
uniref:ATPase AAA-type core domain-containing protein n=1 Tax=Strigamia maritima TaxID=126957 RepID=T1J8L7_STRMM